MAAFRNTGLMVHRPPGAKKGVGIGVLLFGICGFLRIFALNYSWLFVCMIGCALAQPFILNAFTKLASNWFPQNEEALASGLLTMAMFIGFAIVMFATDLILAYYKETGTARQGMEAILNIYGVLALLSVVLFFLFIRERPEYTPNPVAAERKVSMTIGLIALFKNRDFLYLLALFFIGLGAFNGMLIKIDSLFMGRRLDIDSALAPGIVEGLLVIGGMFEAAILAALSDRYRRRKVFLVLSAGLAVPLTIMLQYVSSIMLLSACAFVLGFFLVAALPIGLTYAVELTHSVPEATSNGILMLSGQISGLPIVFFFSMNLVTMLFVAALICALLLKEIKTVSS
jgi:MFS family permease